MAAWHKLTDQQLVALLKEGDQQAFSEIYVRYGESLAGFAASKLYNLDDARDILQDMFVKLWENRAQIHITSTLQSYLFTIIRHRIIDKVRKNVTREEYAAMLQSLRSVFEPAADQQLEAKQLRQNIETSLCELPPRVKEIYKLSRDEGLGNREIAEKLGLSEQTVKNQLTVALKHLRKVLSAAGILALITWLVS